MDGKICYREFIHVYVLPGIDLLYEHQEVTGESQLGQLKT